MKNYIIPVNFTITYTVEVEVEEENEAEAKIEAEGKACRYFHEDLNLGHLGGGDFVCEAQEPI